jgi:hypothetical protein
MAKYSDFNGEGAKAPSPFARAPVTTIRRKGVRLPGEIRIFVYEIRL